AQSVGAVRIDPSDFPRAHVAIADLEKAIHSGVITADSSEVVELVLAALTRAQIGVRAVELIDAPWFRSPEDVTVSKAQIAAMPQSRIRGLQANRVDDGFYSTFVVRKLSKPLSSVAIKLRMSPNLVTVISFIVGVAAALSFAQGARWALVLGAFLLQLSLILDCVDGEVARATHRFSVIGAWLDASTDRVKEYAVYAGLATGAVVNGVASQLAWCVAVILMIVQTARHMGDYNFAAIQKMREAALPFASIIDPQDPWGDGAATFSVRVNSRSGVRWVKKVIHMPIGERWLVLSVVAAVLTPLFALYSLLALTSLAWLYTLMGRVLRTRRWAKTAVGVDLICAQLDNGPLFDSLPKFLRRLPGSRWNWANPMINRLIEMGVVAGIAIVWFPQWITLAFGYLFIIAFHHYDNLYRALARSQAPRWLTWGALGRDSRMIIVVIAALIGITAFYDALNLGVAWLFMWCVIVASAQYLNVQSSPAQATSTQKGEHS
ncbi:MAG: CDP-alcohol phosphatidyltransferase family protein, partial [Actinobacteria bacterium]|nr:CDP-alcohol phosphatidyltransferase family protein [Actinomycetota bacterium]